MSMLPHDYLSTACLHGHHDYCKSDKNVKGLAKKPGECKFCGSACRCDCHKEKS